jgi:hypothetical protein
VSPIVELHDHPTLSSPPLIVGLEGWIDAGLAAATAAQLMSDAVSAEPIAVFDTDILIDYRARRPIMTLDDGLVTEFSWAEIQLSAGATDDGQDVLFLTGPEPDRCWKEFTRVVTELALSLDVSKVIGLGAYPAPVPHTRPTRLALTTASPAISERMLGYVRGSLEVPAGVFGALEQSFYSHGIDAFCLWAQVPHYAANLPYPAGTLALIEGVNGVSGLGFTTAKAAAEAAGNRVRLDELIAANPDHQTLLRQLEAFADSEVGTSVRESAAVGDIDYSDLPSGDQLAEEFQEFLRASGDHTEDSE